MVIFFMKEISTLLIRLGWLADLDGGKKMTKTFCDFCETYIPNPSSSNVWYLPIWEDSVFVRGGRRDAVLLSGKGIVSKELCLCDSCIHDIATLTTTYKTEKKKILANQSI